MSHLNATSKASRISVHRNGIAQVIAFGAWRVVEFTTKTFDALNEYLNTVGNYYFQPINAGYYLVTAQLNFIGAIIAPDYIQLQFSNLAGVPYINQGAEPISLTNRVLSLTGILYLTSNNRVYVRTQTSVALGSTLNGVASLTYFHVHRLS